MVIPPHPALNSDIGRHGQPGRDTILETAAWAVITAGCGPSVFCFSVRGLQGVTAHLAPLHYHGNGPVEGVKAILYYLPLSGEIVSS